jgi:hypothetical protein
MRIYLHIGSLIVKNPVLPHGAAVLLHGASSKEKAILAIHPHPLGWAPALPGGAFWLFHVKSSLFFLKSGLLLFIR